MSRVFPKLTRAIEVAKKTGVPDLQNELSTKNCYFKCKAENMPKANIDALLKATGKTQQTSLK